MTRRIALLTRIAGAAAVTLAFALPGPASAATINVTTTADAIGGSGCSLREAISAANDNTTGPGLDCTAGEDNPVTDTIMIPASPNHYKITLPGSDGSNAAGDFDVFTKAVFIGGGQGNTVIDGNGIDRVFELQNGSEFVEFRDLTIQGGRAKNGSAGAAGGDQSALSGSPSTGLTGGVGDSGGGIRNATALTLTRVTLVDNRAGNGGDGGAGGAGGSAGGGAAGASSGGTGGTGGTGGAIATFGSNPVNIVDSTLTDNFAGAGGTGGAGGVGGTGATAAAGGTGAVSQGGQGGFGGGGGAIFENEGTLTLTRTTVTNNVAGDGGTGGAGGTGGTGGQGTSTGGGAGGASIGGQAVFGGSGGGIDQEDGSTTVVNSTISDNAAGNGGDGGAGGGGGPGGTGTAQGPGGPSQGGLAGPGGPGGGWLGFGSLMNASESTFSGNSAGQGGTGGTGGAGGTSTTVPGTSTGGNGNAGGPGAGLDLGGASSPSLTNVTVAQNSAGKGGNGGDSPTGTDGNGGGGGTPGGIDVSTVGTTTVTHATIAGNSAGAGGTGATAGFPGTVGGITGAGNITMRNDIVASNTGSECGGAITFSGHSISFPNDASCGADMHGNPLLGALGNNGGATRTMSLGAGSPAIDAATTGFPCSTTATDQRGVSRPKGTSCDLGAVERSFPIAATGAASAVTRTGASLAGAANPGQLPTTYRFQFGKTAAYGSQTAAVNAGSGAANVAALATLSGLDKNTTYHYRLVVTNPDGTAQGEDRTFTTVAAFAGVGIVTKKATVKKKVAKIKLACPMAAVTKCTGTLKLTVKVKKNGQTKTLKLGRVSFDLATGQTKTVKVKISKKGLALLKKKGKLSAKARTSAVDALGGTPVVKTAKVTLKAPN
ncbi:MAG: hypothetical protein QOJ14_2063 [Thermoleophilaceae bacterium]|nr:hypothetical protein [Thermoleophilaceae bacterium]